MNSGITFIVFFSQEKPLPWKKINRHPQAGTIKHENFYLLSAFFISSSHLRNGLIFSDRYNYVTLLKCMVNTHAIYKTNRLIVCHISCNKHPLALINFQSFKVWRLLENAAYKRTNLFQMKFTNFEIFAFSIKTNNYHY